MDNNIQIIGMFIALCFAFVLLIYAIGMTIVNKISKEADMSDDIMQHRLNMAFMHAVLTVVGESITIPANVMRRADHRMIERIEHGDGSVTFHRILMDYPEEMT